MLLSGLLSTKANVSRSVDAQHLHSSKDYVFPSNSTLDLDFGSVEVRQRHQDAMAWYDDNPLQVKRLFAKVIQLTNMNILNNYYHACFSYL